MTDPAPELPHSPLPWHPDKIHNGTLIRDKEGIAVTLLLDGFNDTAKIADFILHRVNAHDHLAETNKRLVEALEYVKESLDNKDLNSVMSVLDHIQCHFTEDAAQIIIELCDEITQALAAAKGITP